MTIQQQQALDSTERFVKSTLEGAEGGHDWFHTQRVRNLAVVIAQSEYSDEFVVEMGALLHDIADSKFHNGDESIGPKLAEEFLESIGQPEYIIAHLINIIQHVSFGGGNFKSAFTSPELMIIQDADRLDALGAIGIARTFNYGGFKNRVLYDPTIEPNLNMTKEEYKKSEAPTINHFYEKLLLLKDGMNTPTAKVMAHQRHEYMEYFLDEFYAEWSGLK